MLTSFKSEHIKSLNTVHFLRSLCLVSIFSLQFLLKNAENMVNETFLNEVYFWKVLNFLTTQLSRNNTSDIFINFENKTGMLLLLMPGFC